MVAHACNPITWESGQKDLSSRPTWATWKDPVSKLFWFSRVSLYACKGWWPPLLRLLR